MWEKDKSKRMPDLISRRLVTRVSSPTIPKWRNGTWIVIIIRVLNLARTIRTNFYVFISPLVLSNYNPDFEERKEGKSQRGTCQDLSLSALPTRALPTFWGSSCVQMKPQLTVHDRIIIYFAVWAMLRVIRLTLLSKPPINKSFELGSKAWPCRSLLQILAIMWSHMDR